MKTHLKHPRATPAFGFGSIGACGKNCAEEKACTDDAAAVTCLDCRCTDAYYDVLFPVPGKAVS